MDLSQAENQVLSALKNYLAAVATQKSSTPLDLVPHCIDLEKLHIALSPELHPQLQHFLESKSYRKAYEFLSSTSELANRKHSAQHCSR
jgi:molybdopterin-guanine dinucleotide biosynthesis protein A